MTLCVDDYGAVGDGIADDTSAIQTAINVAQSAGGGVVGFTAGKNYKAGSLSLTNKYVTLSGFGAKLTDAAITVAYPVASGFTIAASFYGLNFVSSSTPHIPILLRRGYDIRFSNCQFTNCSKAIHVEPTSSDFDVRYHCVGALTIDNCDFDFVDYCLYGTRNAGLAATGGFQEWLILGDVTFTNNVARVARKTHVHLDNVDGLVCAHNTLFHYGSDGVTMTKGRCVNVAVYGAQITIDDNQMFEPGLEAIKLNNCRIFKVTKNNIVQPGQVNLSSGILVTNASAQSSQGSKVTGNTIYQPTKYGIEVVNTTQMSVDDNFVVNDTADPAHYYGDSNGNPAATTVTHYALSLSGSNDVSGDNRDTGNLPINTSGTVRKPRYTPAIASVTSNLTTLPAQFDQLNLAMAGATTVTSIDTGYEGQTLTLKSGNANTTISHTAGIRLAGAVNWKMPSDGVLVLKYTGPTWVEIGRTDITADTGTTTLTPTATAGSFASATADVRWWRSGTKVDIQIKARIVSAGSASGGIIVPLPFAATEGASFHGREAALSGFSVNGSVWAGGTFVTLYKYDFTTIIATGRTVLASGTIYVA